MGFRLFLCYQLTLPKVSRARRRRQLFPVSKRVISDIPAWFLLIITNLNGKHAAREKPKQDCHRYRGGVFRAYRSASISVTIAGPLKYTLCAKLSNLNNSINYFELESGGV